MTTEAAAASQTVRIDYLTVTDGGDVDAWLELAVALTEGGEVEVLGGRYQYERCYRVGGVLDVLTGRRQETMPAVCVEVRGEGCAWLGFGRLRALEVAAARVTRLDLAIDGAPVTPRQLLEAWERGDRRSRAHLAGWHRSLGRRGTSTFEVGSRHANRQLVAYDRRGATRVEVRLRRDLADAERGLLAGGEAGLMAAALEQVRATVDFVDAGSDANPSRRRLLEWWAAFVGAVGVATRTLAVRSTPGVARRLAWVRGTVARTLAALVDGGLDLAAVLEDARGALEPRHRALTHQMARVPLSPGGSV